MAPHFTTPTEEIAISGRSWTLPSICIFRSSFKVFQWSICMPSAIKGSWNIGILLKKELYPYTHASDSPNNMRKALWNFPSTPHATNYTKTAPIIWVRLYPEVTFYWGGYSHLPSRLPPTNVAIPIEKDPHGGRATGKMGHKYFIK